MIVRIWTPLVKILVERRGSRISENHSTWLPNILKHKLGTRTIELRASYMPNEISKKCFLQEKKVKCIELSKKNSLMKVFAEFGVTAVIFHSTVALISMMGWYALVRSGLDVPALMTEYNILPKSTFDSNFSGAASAFVIAYACHSVILPFRAFITVFFTPLIVKKLRVLGFLSHKIK